MGRNGKGLLDNGYPVLTPYFLVPYHTELTSQLLFLFQGKIYNESSIYGIIPSAKKLAETNGKIQCY